MKNKKEMKLKGSKLMLIGTGLVILIGFIVLVSALSDREALQQELNQLEQNLTSSGYSWLVNYNISYPSVGVFRENSNEEVTRFENVAQTGWYKIYLTNLNDNESYYTFDLKSVGLVDKTMPRDILLKKMRIDEIRKEMKGGKI